MNFLDALVERQQLGSGLSQQVILGFESLYSIYNFLGEVDSVHAFLVLLLVHLLVREPRLRSPQPNAHLVVFQLVDQHVVIFLLERGLHQEGPLQQKFLDLLARTEILGVRSLFDDLECDLSHRLHGEGLATEPGGLFDLVGFSDDGLAALRRRGTVVDLELVDARIGVVVDGLFGDLGLFVV